MLAQTQAEFLRSWELRTMGLGEFPLLPTRHWQDLTCSSFAAPLVLIDIGTIHLKTKTFIVFKSTSAKDCLS